MPGAFDVESLICDDRSVNTKNRREHCTTHDCECFTTLTSSQLIKQVRHALPQI